MSLQNSALEFSVAEKNYEQERLQCQIKSVFTV